MTHTARFRTETREQRAAAKLADWCQRNADNARVLHWLERNAPPATWRGTDLEYAYTEMMFAPK